MIYVFLGKDVTNNARLVNLLNQFDIEYELLLYSEIDQIVLDFFMLQSSDCFEFLSNRFKHYKMSEELTYSQFCQKILSDVERNIKFPLVVKDDDVYAGLTDDDKISLVLPKKVRFVLGRSYLLRSQCYQKKSRRANL